MRLPVLCSVVDRSVTYGRPQNIIIRPGPLLEEDEAGERLQSCIRVGRLEGQDVTHCFLRKIDRHGNVTDSISFGPDEKGVSDKRPGAPIHCETVKFPVTHRDWQIIKGVYQNVCANNAFGFLKNDCCTCSVKALNAVNAVIPDHARYANMKIAN